MFPFGQGGNGRNIQSMDVDNGKSATSQQSASAGSTQQVGLSQLQYTLATVPRVQAPFAKWSGFGSHASSSSTATQQPALGATGRPSAPTTLAGHFLSQSASLTTALTRPSIAAPSSLQMIPTMNRVQVMLPDDKGILRAHLVWIDTAKHITHLVEAEEQMDAAVQASGLGIMMPSTSLGSVPSTSSLHSSTASLGSQFSEMSTGQSIDFTTALRQLSQMLGMARTQQDVDRIQAEIQKLLGQHGQQQPTLSFAAEGNKK